MPKKEAAVRIARTKHTLLKPHRHGGLDLDKGAEIMLTEKQVIRLQKAKKIAA